MTDDRQAHWEGVYSSKGEADVSWFQEAPQPSMDLFKLIGAKPSDAIIDVGGGASRLVDHLNALGHKHITVLDLSSAALKQAEARLGKASSIVEWIAADASTWSPSSSYDIWHDRAAFHFLTEPEQQLSYMDRVRSALRPGGHVVIGTFAPDGPEKCSGLPVARHNAKSLGEHLGDSFALLDTRNYEHLTPWASKQKFQFSTFIRLNDRRQ